MTTSSRRTATRAAAAAVVAAFLVGGSGAAHAQPSSRPSAADLESARELYKEGKELRTKGDLRGALEKFKLANAYGHTPVTALELGKTHAQLGELVEAREALLSVGRMKVESDETEKSASAREEASQLAEQLRPRIPTLNIAVLAPAETRPKVSVDGVTVPVVSHEATRKTNPGAHVVVATIGEHEERADVTLAEGETRVVTLSFANDVTDGGGAGGAGGGAADGGGGGANGANGANGASDANGGDASRGGRSISPLVWAGLGVGAVGAGIGAVTGILALGRASTVHDECDGTSCPPEAKKDVDSGRTVATISTVAFVAGGVGLAVAAVGWFALSPKKKASSTSATLRAVAGPTWVGVDGRF
jgi:hypothetical protein